MHRPRSSSKGMGLVRYSLISCANMLNFISFIRFFTYITSAPLYYAYQPINTLLLFIIVLINLFNADEERILNIIVILISKNNIRSFNNFYY